MLPWNTKEVTVDKLTVGDVPLTGAPKHTSVVGVHLGTDVAIAPDVVTRPLRLVVTVGVEVTAPLPLGLDGEVLVDQIAGVVLPLVAVPVLTRLL